MQMRKIAMLTLSVSLAVTLSACGAGKNAPTAMINQTTDGVDGSITTYGNNLKAVSVLLVSQPDGSAVLVGTIVNDNPTPDVLSAISINGVKATLTPATLPLKQDAPVIFSGPSANASATAPGLHLTAGSRTIVKLYFDTAGELTLDTLVRDRSGIYANVGP